MLSKDSVLMQIPKGAANARTGKNIASYLCQRNTREIRLLIQELIADGYPICSSTQTPAGYFLAETREEVNENLKVLKYGYGREIFRHYKYLAHARDKMFPQIGMPI